MQETSEQQRPPIRWGFVVWGAVFLGLAITVLTIVQSGDSAAWDWIIGIDPGQLLIGVAIIIGGLALIFGLIGMLNQSSKSNSKR